MSYFKNLLNAFLGKKDSNISIPEFLITTRGNWTGSISMSDDEDSDEDSVKRTKDYKKKIAVKPKDVYDELERVPTNFSLEALEDKIEILKLKHSFINQSNVKKEVNDFIELLENRKKYDKKAKDGKTFREFFCKYDATNDQKIQVLLSKYELVMRSPDIFIPEFPAEAVQAMKIYTEKIEELCGKKPVFFVIATEDSFKKTYEKRDPILLASSPFGFYYYILGAWDEEMILLTEL